jgi:hypothetical protein
MTMNRNMKKHHGQQVYVAFMERDLNDISPMTTLGASFWGGYNAQPYKRGEKGSFCDAAWLAGKDRKKESQ